MIDRDGHRRATSGFGMADIVNLRNARKQAKRKSDAERAQTNRLAFGRPIAERKRDAAERDKAADRLDRHRIERGRDE